MNDFREVREGVVVMQGDAFGCCHTLQLWPAIEFHLTQKPMGGERVLLLVSGPGRMPAHFWELGRQPQLC